MAQVEEKADNKIREGFQYCLNLRVGLDQGGHDIT